MSITLDLLDASLHTIAIEDAAGNALLIDASGHLSINDGGNSLTIDGTVAATQSGTWNIGTVASITADVNIADGGNSITIDDGGGSITIDGTVTTTLGSEVNEDAAVISGQALNMIGLYRQDTLATDTTTNGDASFGKVSALGELYVKDSTIGAAIAGSEMQVDIVAALPAGTNNIGDVDILTMPGTQTEDGASAGGETLMMVGGYRQDANTSPVSADGDFHGFIFNATGELKVSSRLDDVADSSVVVTTVTVNTTVGGVQLVASGLSSRRDYTVQNLGSQDIWLKSGTGVTAGAAGNGFKLPKGSSMTKKWGPTIDLYGITAASTASIKVIEAA